MEWGFGGKRSGFAAFSLLAEFSAVVIAEFPMISAEGKLL